MKDGVENYWGYNGIKIYSTRTRTKMLVSFESHLFDRVTRPEPGKQTRLNIHSEMQAFLAVLLCFAWPKSLGKFV